MRILLLTVAAIVGVWIAGSYLRDMGNDASITAVIGQIHALQTAQVDFYSRHGRYAASIEELAPELELDKGPYRFRVTAKGNSYSIEAAPASGHGQVFLSDETMVVRTR
jgi:hypothetical protein